MTRVYLGLGSNLGDRAGLLAFARRRLEEAGLRITAASNVEETAPFGEVEQPGFLNQVLEADTDLGPAGLLTLAKRVEREAGRQPGGVRWGPRELDVDILLFEGVVMETEELTIPHPGLIDREFLQRELAEVAPTLVADAVILVEYDQRWPGRFEAEAVRLQQAFGPLATRVDHVGSTSVRGLVSKSIIDIQLSVPAVADDAAYTPRLEALGYAYVPDPRFPTYPFFRAPAEGERRFHLHVCEAGSVEEREHLVFRDQLREHPGIAGLYRDLKRDLARRYFADRVAYSNAKSEFVRWVLDMDSAPA